MSRAIDFSVISMLSIVAPPMCGVTITLCLRCIFIKNSDALGSTIETSVPYPDKRARSSESTKIFHQLIDRVPH